MTTTISVIIPVYNEEKILERNITKLYNHLVKIKKHKKIKNFEIIISDNGSTDRTKELAIELSKKYFLIRYLRDPKRGLGIGLRKGILNAKYGYCLFYAVDLPFNLPGTFEKLIEGADEGYDIVYYSKIHKRSTQKRLLKRKILSNGYNILLRLFTGINSDTLSVVLFNTKKTKSIIKNLTSNDMFFLTQMHIYSRYNNFKIKELPVKYDETKEEGRKSKVRTIIDPLKLIKNLFFEYINLRKIGWKRPD